jgi:hypothetical protein
LHLAAFGAASDANKVPSAAQATTPQEQLEFEAQFNDFKDRAVGLQAGAWVSYVVAAGLVGTGVYFLFFAGDEEPAGDQSALSRPGSPGAVVPWIAPTPEGVAAGASWRF